MTIVAGFRVKDGVLICSDTQYTGGAKICQQKLFPLTITGDSYLFGLAGHEQNGKMAIDECQDAIEDLEPGKRTARSVKKALRLAVKPVVDEYVLSRPASERDGVAFELLVGCWIPNGGHRLFAIGTGGAINNVSGYECLGAGSYLSHYLIRPAFYKSMGMEAVMLLAAQALRCTKAYDANCGGQSAFRIIRANGAQEEPFYDFYHADIYLNTYETQERSLLFFMSPHNKDEAAFEVKLREFTETAKSIRDSWKKLDESQKNLLRALPQKPDDIGD